MKSFLLFLTLLLFIPFHSTRASEISLYEQLLTVNKYWAEQNAPKSLKETYITLNRKQLIQAHLLLAENKLRNESTSHLTQQQTKKRIKALDELKQYALKGVFPINLHHSYTIPYFIDDYGTACAVGQLIIKSNHKDLALKIKAKDNYAYIAEMNYSALNLWASEHGFTKKDLMWIQPAYAPICQPGTVKDPECHDGTGCINTDYQADSLIPPYQELFEYNDGTGWLTDTNGWIMRWQGARVGNHRITVTDSLNTVKVYSYTINNVPEMLINSTVTDQTSTACNGTASISIQNGKAPYIIEIQNQALQFWDSDSSGNFDSLCSGTYLVVVYDDYRCQKTGSFTIDNITSLPESKLSVLQLYPNPFQNQLVVEIKDRGNVAYKVYSISGKALLTGTIINEKQAINTQALSTGVYFIDFMKNGEHLRKKLVKTE